MLECGKKQEATEEKYHFIMMGGHYVLHRNVEGLGNHTSWEEA